MITQARNGDLIRVIRHVKPIDESSEEGALAVRAFRMTLQHKSIEGQKEVKKIPVVLDILLRFLYYKIGKGAWSDKRRRQKKLFFIYF